jgi:hypothetical protein
MLRHFLWLISTIIAFAICLFVPYPLGTKARANGIPLPYVIWEQLENGAWADFVGCLTLVAIPLDFGVAVALSVVAWRVLKRCFPAQRHSRDPASAASDQSV